MEGVENEEEPLTFALCVLERGTERVLLPVFAERVYFG
jgi:hypothetical protein